MKIVFLLPNLTTQGGMERIVAGLANLLSSAFSYEITILSCYNRDGGAVYPLDPRVKVATLNAPDYPRNPVKRILWYIRLVKPVSNWLEQNPNNVIMAKGSYLCTMLCFLRNKRIIKIGCEHISYKAVNPVQRLLRRLFYHRLDHVVVLTENDRAGFASWFPRVTTIPNFIDSIPEKKAALNSKLIISAGRLVWQKGYDLLLEASVAVFNAYPDWRLVVFGEGADRQALEKLRNKLNLKNHVSFPGEIKNVLPELMKASLFVIPSRYEGFPVSLLEAASVGLPAVGFRVSGPDVLIEHGHNGLLAEAGNTDQLSAHIIRLLGNAEERTQFGLNSAELAERFSAPVVAERWRGLLEGGCG